MFAKQGSSSNLKAPFFETHVFFKAASMKRGCLEDDACIKEKLLRRAVTGCFEEEEGRLEEGCLEEEC